MRVRDLIAALGTLDPDLPVVMRGETIDFVEVAEALVDTLRPIADCPGGWELVDETDEGFRYVARLFGEEPG
jgi:hypothetical protein